MRAIICNKLKEEDPSYFKRAWRIPYEELANLGWISVDQSEIETTISSYFIKKYNNELPSVILFWNTNTLIQNNLSDIVKHSWTKCIYMDDLHQSSSKVKNFRNIILEKFDYIFTTYAYTFLKFYPTANPDKLIWYPHNINNNFLVEFNENPMNKILLSGGIDKNIYPFRNHVSKLKKSYPIEILGHLGYTNANHKYYGHNYIKYINKYVAAVTCCSNSNTPYIVNKFFEIPGAGALLLAYDQFIKEPLKELGFIDGENYLSVDYQNFEKKLNFVINPSNRTEIDRIRKNGYVLVWERHTLQNRVKLIENTVKK